tara:strand:+ start:100 stop:324 length:225 start_codon:yes stop_codon:yes gene_type:complete
MGFNMIYRIRKRGNMNKEIQIQMKNVFGVNRIYPICHIANALIKLKFPNKTFNENDLNVFKSLGLIIKWKAGQV